MPHNSLLTDSSAESWLRLILEAWELRERLADEWSRLIHDKSPDTVDRWHHVTDLEGASQLRLNRRLEKAHAALLG